jgi:hypothetical protein
MSSVSVDEVKEAREKVERQILALLESLERLNVSVDGLDLEAVDTNTVGSPGATSKVVGVRISLHV